MSRYLLITLIFIALCSCCNGGETRSGTTGKDTVIIHDTILPDGSFVFDLPCKIEYINTALQGKASLVFWLHGGVMDRNAHSLLNESNNHIDQWRNTAYDSISHYLHTNGIKAIYIAPVCHKATSANCVRWIECEKELKHIIDDHVNKGLVDPERIYVAGSSDGGYGTWDLIERHSDWFAAAIAMSCNNPRKTSIPVIYSSTRREGDMSTEVNALNAQGCKIQYSFYPNEDHAGDEQHTCNNQRLSEFFKHVRNERAQ